MNQVLNHLKAENGITNFDAFIKFSRSSCLGISFDVISTAERPYITRNANKLPHFKVKQLFQKLYIPFDFGRME